MTTINKMKRVFIVGGTEIEDPAPSLSLDKTTQILAQTYPHFRWTEVYEEDGKVVGNTLQFTLIMPPPKVNG